MSLFPFLQGAPSRTPPGAFLSEHMHRVFRSGVLFGVSCLILKPACCFEMRSMQMITHCLETHPLHPQSCQTGHTGI